jgi:cell wall-associated NlpC family hydrolase
MRMTAAYLRRRVAITLVLMLLHAPVAVRAYATPSTPEIEAKQAEAEAAQAELERMNVSLEIQIEAYNAITEALDQTREQIRVTRLELEKAERDLRAAKKKLGARATNIYKEGGTGVLDVFLGTRSFQDFMMRLDFAVRLNRTDAELVAQVKDAKARVLANERALEQRLSEQVTLQSEAANRAQQIESDVAAQERFIGQLEGEVRTLIAQEEERLRKIAEERARQAALAAAARKSTAADRTAAELASLGAGKSAVVDVALQYLGVPYLWGGSTPLGFDCSGLTQYCYRQVGISIPRTSQSQYQAGQHIARDRLDVLRSGDLVFFGTDGDASRVHHVGMYVGDGNYIHAPNTGAVVRIDSLTERIASRGDYVGASRF